MRHLFIVPMALLGFGLLPSCGMLRGDAAPAIARGDPPAYDVVAARHNQRVERLGRVWGRAAVQIRYNDRDGDRQWEQGEGHLSLVRPDRVALSVGKLGQTLFWLGGNKTLYWWMDLSEDPHLATFGRYDGAARAGRLGSRLGGLAASISPPDLFRLAAILPWPETSGVMQWSADGRLLGAVIEWTGAGAGGRQRTWLEPESGEPRKVELFDPAGECVLVADLSEYEPVEITGDSRIRPEVPGRVFIGHRRTDTELRLYLSGLEDDSRRFAADAFDFASLCRSLGVQRTIDLDERAKDESTRRAPRELGGQP